jgi:uncharacterized protein
MLESRKVSQAVGIALAASFAVGCGVDPQKYYVKIRANLVTHNYEAAAKFIDESKKDIYKDEDNRLLYMMDRGMVLSLAKKYQESNQILEEAKQTAEDLWTESISANAAAFLTTDNSIPYQGEDFEKVTIHFIAAMNFIGMGDYAGARVEARQITNKLELYNSKYEEGQNVYKDDAFSRWLAGKLAATAGQEGLNDAWIDYKKALEVYETDYAQRYATGVPQLLVQDALYALEALGDSFKPEYDALRAKWPAIAYKTPAEAKEMGEIVFIHMNGEAPYKVDKFWDAQAGDEWIRIAYPEFVAKPHRILSSSMSVGGQPVGSTELTQPLTAIAMQNLNDKMGRIQAKAIARAVTKYIAAKATQAAGNAVADQNATLGAAMWLAGAIFQTASNVAEEADKRSWITLPGDIYVGRAYVTPGTVALDIEFKDGSGMVVDRTTLNAEVKAGETKFVTYRTYD